MPRLLPLVAMLSSLVSVGASAADLDPYPQPRYRPAPVAPVLPEPPPRIYSRPVVGFYGYPYDHLTAAPYDPAIGSRPPYEPYVLKRDTPHGIAPY